MTTQAELQAREDTFFLTEPPIPTHIPLPVDFDHSALTWLRAMGLVDRRPPVRASDYERILSDPFLFYLTRILGIVPALRTHADALEDGGWLHERARFIYQQLPDGSLPPTSESSLQARFTSLHDDRLETARLFNFPPTLLHEVSKKMKQSFAVGRTWWEVASVLPVIPISNHARASLHEILLSHTPIATETTFTLTTPLSNELTLQVTPDLITRQGSDIDLWDWKSTSAPPTVRLSTCLNEQQTLQYLDVIAEAISRGLPPFQPGDRLRSIKHVAISKPGIRLSGTDRDFRTLQVTPTRGPNRGITRDEKEYYGEPQLSNYLARTRRWYKGEGEYLTRLDELRLEPPVNISTITHNLIPPYLWDKYRSRLQFIRSYYLNPHPTPSSYPDNPRSMVDKGRPSLYHEFFTQPVQEWTRIMAEKAFIVEPLHEAHLEFYDD